jgi:hypothetical protein
VTGRANCITGQSTRDRVVMRIKPHLAAFVIICAGISLLPVVLSTPAHSREKEWQRQGNFNTPQAPSRKKKPNSPARQILPQSGPARCDWVQSKVSEYAFENVKVRSCDGSAYIFDATREGRAFTIYMSTDTGELLKVEKFQSGGTEQTNGQLTQQPR